MVLAYLNDRFKGLCILVHCILAYKNQSKRDQCVTMYYVFETVTPTGRISPGHGPSVVGAGSKGVFAGVERFPE